MLKERWVQHGVSVPSFMVDMDRAQINSLRDVFPGTPLYLCAFHREQSVTRYERIFLLRTHCLNLTVICRFVRSARSGLSTIATRVKSDMTKLANSLSVDAFKKNLDVIQSSEYFRRNVAFRQWFNWWLADKEVHGDKLLNKTMHRTGLVSLLFRCGSFSSGRALSLLTQTMVSRE